MKRKEYAHDEYSAFLLKGILNIWPNKNFDYFGQDSLDLMLASRILKDLFQHLKDHSELIIENKLIDLYTEACFPRDKYALELEYFGNIRVGLSIMLEIPECAKKFHLKGNVKKFVTEMACSSSFDTAYIFSAPLSTLSNSIQSEYREAMIEFGILPQLDRFIKVGPTCRAFENAAGIIRNILIFGSLAQAETLREMGVAPQFIYLVKSGQIQWSQNTFAVLAYTAKDLDTKVFIRSLTDKIESNDSGELKTLYQITNYVCDDVASTLKNYKCEEKLLGILNSDSNSANHFSSRCLENIIKSLPSIINSPLKEFAKRQVRKYLDDNGDWSIFQLSCFIIAKSAIESDMSHFIQGLIIEFNDDLISRASESDDMNNPSKKKLNNLLNCFLFICSKDAAAAKMLWEKDILEKLKRYFPIKSLFKLIGVFIQNVNDAVLTKDEFQKSLRKAGIDIHFLNYAFIFIAYTIRQRNNAFSRTSTVA